MAGILRSPKIVAGLLILAFFVVLALFGPLLVGADPTKTHSVGLAGPSAATPVYGSPVGDQADRLRSPPQRRQGRGPRSAACRPAG